MVTPPTSTSPTPVERAARQLVAQTFFGTLLKQARGSPLKSELMSGGRGGEAFGSMFDAHLAEKLGRGVGGRLVDAIVRKLDPAARHQPSAASLARKAYEEATQ